MTANAELAREVLERGQKDPVWWVETFLGQKFWGLQKEIAYAVRDNPRVAVSSCHGSGKTYETASLALWFAYNFKGSMVITTAPGDRQVKVNMWGEIEVAYNRARVPLGGRFFPRSARYELGPKWGMLGFATDRPGRFSGFHYPYVFIIIDEASEIEEYVFQEIEGIRSAGHMVRVIMLSQMTRTTGAFYNAFHRDRNLWKCFTISAFDTPNFAPEVIETWKAAGSPAEGYPWPQDFLINPPWVSDLEKSAGKDSDLYRVKVLGIEPKGEASALIPLHMVETANKRVLPVPKEGWTWMGLDVATSGDDECYAYIRRGPVVLYCEEFKPISQNQTQEIVDWALELAVRFGVTDINCDDIGVGKGVFDVLSEAAPMRGLRAHPINFGSRPRDVEHFMNRRAEDYMGLRQRFESGEITLLNIAEDPAGRGRIDRLMPELTGLKRKPTSPMGKMVLEAKVEYKKRLGRSPDAADALCLAFALPDDELAIFTMYDNAPENFGRDLEPLPGDSDPFFDMTPDF